ncbi:hypothetical protein IAT38_002753 [Cryptococcus sp. DSM 104549]
MRRRHQGSKKPPKKNKANVNTSAKATASAAASPPSPSPPTSLPEKEVTTSEAVSEGSSRESTPPPELSRDLHASASLDSSSDEFDTPLAFPKSLPIFPPSLPHTSHLLPPPDLHFYDLDNLTAARRPSSFLAVLPRSFSGLWLLCISFFGQVYLSFYEMALGLSRLWGGTAPEEKSGEEVKLVERKEQKVKRRRRKIDSPVPGAGGSGKGEHFSGMVNLSGTLCYMNSVLQSFASIGSLARHLEKLVEYAVEVDMPTHVTDALLDVIRDLNTPHKHRPRPLRPEQLLAALQSLPAVRRLLSTREQQDAHELFLVLAEAISDEAVKVAAEIGRARGLGELLSLQGYIVGKGDAGGTVQGDVEGAKKRKKIRGVAQPWEGLMARRRVCRMCEWSEAVRMDMFGGMELPVPLHGDTTLEACIAEYLAPEHLTDVTCEMCSLKLTQKHYQAEVERLSAPPNPQTSRPKQTNGYPPAYTPSGSFSALEDLPTSMSALADGGQLTASRKRRAREARRVETRLQEMLESNTVSNFGESTLTPLPTAASASSSTASTAPIPVKWLTARTSSIRQAIVTRPPNSLRLHFIRSEFTMYGSVVKKTARVAFPLVLDMTRFVADGVWEEHSGGVRGMMERSAGQGGTSLGGAKRVLYRLESAILHYGYTHSSGHFVCIRRKPLPLTTSASTTVESEPNGHHGPQPYHPESVSKSCPDGCQCEACAYYGQIRDQQPAVPGKGWLLVSDADVEEVGQEALYEARGAVVMLFYERVGEYTGDMLPERMEVGKSMGLGGVEMGRSVEPASVGMERGAEPGGAGMKRGSVGMERESVGMERGSVGMERGSVGMERTSVGMERASVGMERGSIGMERASVGMERGSVGMERGSVGMEREGFGMEREWTTGAGIGEWSGPVPRFVDTESEDP